MSETEPQFKGPAIAVVVPVHNGAAFLQQCLASLAAQTFGDFACFVVDDGSTDESAELAAAWESRDAIVGDDRAAELLAQNNVAAFGAQGDLNGISQLVNAGAKSLAGVFALLNLFCHKSASPFISKNS